ncbi:MAG: hypothetical protein PHH54_03480 [Candidatus Nanoarchaeia archaeon]|nr:hypothetical protein [Candidatus Nanoarchaeia archaeon]MDD5741019.1 hypothetical protein [Candidatus Nanoarchaeia archaeon]
MDDLDEIVRISREVLGSKDPTKDYIECPKCHNKYHWNVVANEPFRTITDADGKNKQKVCEDCYWKWIDGDITRYFPRIEETDKGFCYVKDLN